MSDTGLREQLRYMFESAWQDGVHHLNPKYLRRDSFFTDEAIKLIRTRERALLAAIRADLVSRGWTASKITQMLNKYEPHAENGDA